MKFNLEDEIKRATEAYLASIGIEIPISIRFQEPADEDEPDRYNMGEEEDTTDWPDDERLDDPRHVPYSNLGRR